MNDPFLAVRADHDRLLHGLEQQEPARLRLVEIWELGHGDRDLLAAVARRLAAEVDGHALEHAQIEHIDAALADLACEDRGTGVAHAAVDVEGEADLSAT